jgi:prepilin-type N-terminal cleavage/methylation domain-containing protein
MKCDNSGRHRVAYSASPPGRDGFSLVEVMIVVVIIGLLATMAVTSIAKVRERSENASVANDLRTFAAAFEQYCLELGSWPPDGGAGVVPAGMEGRVNEAAWTRGSPGAGRYDWEKGTFGVTAAISLFGCNFDNERLARVDLLIDDGNINTGRFRRVGDGRPMFVLEP